MAMFVALAIVLDFVKELIPFLNMPSGGSINIALIPVVVAGFFLGPIEGMMTGFLWWLLTFVLGLNKWFICVPQYLLDYIVPSVIIGAASIFYKKRTIMEAELGIVITMVTRALSILISGAYYWPGDAAAGSAAAWTGSIAYNLPYSLATMVMLMAIVPLVLKALKKYMV